MTHSIKYENVFYEIFISDGVSRVAMDISVSCTIFRIARCSNISVWHENLPSSPSQLPDDVHVILVFHYNYISADIKFISYSALLYMSVTTTLRNLTEIYCRKSFMAYIGIQFPTSISNSKSNIFWASITNYISFIPYQTFLLLHNFCCIRVPLHQLVISRALSLLIDLWICPNIGNNSCKTCTGCRVSYIKKRAAAGGFNSQMISTHFHLSKWFTWVQKNYIFLL